MRYITESDVENNLPMDQLIDKLGDVFTDYSKGNSASSQRVRTHVDGALLNTLPSVSNLLGIGGLKTYVSTKSGTRHIVVLFDLNSSELLSVIEARKLGQMRTGAVPAVITKLIVTKKDPIFALIGSGFQAQSQLEAMMETFSLAEARIFSRNSDHAQKFADWALKRHGWNIMVCGSIKEAISGADIINTITRSSEPFLFNRNLSDSYHINLTGANSLNNREASDEVMSGSDLIIVEHLEQSRNESAEVNVLFDNHMENKVHDMRDLIQDRALLMGKSKTIFKTMGIGLEDVTAGYIVMKNLGIV